MSDYEDEELQLDDIDLAEHDERGDGTHNNDRGDGDDDDDNTTQYHPQPYPNLIDLHPYFNRTGYYHNTILGTDGLHNSPYVAAAVTHTLDLMSKPNTNIKQFMPFHQYRRREVIRAKLDSAELVQRTWDHSTLHAAHATKTTQTTPATATPHKTTTTTTTTTKKHMPTDPEGLERLYNDIVAQHSDAPLHRWTRAMSTFTNAALNALRDRYPHLIDRIATHGTRHTIGFKPSAKFPTQTGNGNLWGVEGRFFKHGLQIESTGFGQPSIILNLPVDANFSEIQAATKAAQNALAHIHHIGGGDAAVTPEDLEAFSMYNRSYKKAQKTNTKLSTGQRHKHQHKHHQQPHQKPVQEQQQQQQPQQEQQQQQQQEQQQ